MNKAEQYNREGVHEQCHPYTMRSKPEIGDSGGKSRELRSRGAWSVYGTCNLVMGHDGHMHGNVASMSNPAPHCGTNGVPPHVSSQGRGYAFSL